jgi:hypothetical protein
VTGPAGDAPFTQGEVSVVMVLHFAAAGIEPSGSAAKGHNTA